MDFVERLDPELRKAFFALPPRNLRDEDLPQARRALRTAFTDYNSRFPFPEGVEISERTIPGPAGAPPVRLRLIVPARRRDPCPAILWTHGGGLIRGEPEQDEPMLATWADRIGCVVAAPAYRLAPEHKYPAAIEDCYAAWSWLKAEAATLGVDINRVAVGGASSGGGTAAALAHMVKDRGGSFCFQLLICPMIDDRCESWGNHAFSDPRIWDGEKNRAAWGMMLGDKRGGREVTKYAAAARAEDLHGLPPTFIMVSTLDPFIDEDMIYAQRLIQADVPTELHVYPRAFHGFHMLAPDAEVSRRARDDIDHAIVRALS